jgi:hypothetical protein
VVRKGDCRSGCVNREGIQPKIKDQLVSTKAKLKNGHEHICKGNNQGREKVGRKCMVDVMNEMDKSATHGLL